MTDAGDRDDASPAVPVADGQADPTDDARSTTDPDPAPSRPPTLASIARQSPGAAAARPAPPAPAPNRAAPVAPSPRPAAPAPARQGPPPPPPPVRNRVSQAPPAVDEDAPDPGPGDSERPWFAPPKADTAPVDREVAPGGHGVPSDAPGGPGSAPRGLHAPPTPVDPTSAPPPPTPAGAPPPAPVGPPRSANPPPAPPPSLDRPDLTEILDQLHDDIDVEPSSAPRALGDALTDPRDLERPTDRNAIVVESTGGIDFRPSFATFGRRGIGFVIDALVLSALVAPGIVIAVVGGGPAVIVGVLVAIAGLVVATAWYARSVARTGQWFGNRVAQTRVVDIRNGRNIAAGDAAARFLIRHLVSVILFIGFLVALGDAQRRTFHDRFAGTVVVGRERQTWSADDETP